MSGVAVFTRILRKVEGVLLTLLAAFCAVWVFDHAAHPAVAPFAFLIVLTLIARGFGTLPAFLGTLISAGIFAYFLFAPIGSLHVADAAAGQSLFWMLLCGIIISEFVPAIYGSSQHRN